MRKEAKDLIGVLLMIVYMLSILVLMGIVMTRLCLFLGVSLLVSQSMFDKLGGLLFVIIFVVQANMFWMVLRRIPSIVLPRLRNYLNVSLPDGN